MRAIDTTPQLERATAAHLSGGWSVNGVLFERAGERCGVDLFGSEYRLVPSAEWLAQVNRLDDIATKARRAHATALDMQATATRHAEALGRLRRRGNIAFAFLLVGVAVNVAGALWQWFGPGAL